MTSPDSPQQPSRRPSPVAGLSQLTLIARGGYSSVYRAWQASMSREVALKVDTRTLETERDRRRFLREAQAAGQMSGHPNIVHVYDAGVTKDNHPYLVMELCTGGSYAAKIKAGEKLSPLTVIDVGVAIADALAAAHKAGILHRDVKPANILINRYGVAGLADFGLAAVYDASRDLSVTVESLTPAYAAPEVFRFEPPTRSGDIYSLAATLYALLAGKPPRWPDTGSPSPVQLIAAHREPLPRLSQIPPALFSVLERAMAYEPSARYGSINELRDGLLHARSTLTPSADESKIARFSPPPSPPVEPSPPQSAPPQLHPSEAAADPRPPSAPPNMSFPQPAAPVPAAYPAPPLSRKPLIALWVLIALLTLTVVVGTIVLATRDSGGPDSVAADCGIQTQQARCVEKPECFSKASRDTLGYGESQTVDCGQAHPWETFVVAKVPASVPNPTYDELQKNPYVVAMCGKETLGRFVADPDNWRIRVLPPTMAQALSGNPEFRCLAGADEPSQSAKFNRS